MKMNLDFRNRTDIVFGSGIYFDFATSQAEMAIIAFLNRNVKQDGY